MLLFEITQVHSGSGEVSRIMNVRQESRKGMVEAMEGDSTGIAGQGTSGPVLTSQLT